MLFTVSQPRTSSMLSALFLGFFIYAAVGCGPDTDTEHADQSEEKISNPIITNLAEPWDYQSPSDDLLGVNENGKGLETGSIVPASITLMDIDGEPFSLIQAWQKQPALIIFYRGGWCPYCNAQVRDLAISYRQLKEAGVQPILISVDTTDKTAMAVAKYEIPFPVLSDPDLIAHTAFNVVLELDKETLEQYKEYGIIPSVWSQREHNSIAVSSIFLVNQNGEVIFSHAPADYQLRPSIDQLLSVIEKYL